jgi:hypothetical protein
MEGKMEIVKANDDLDDRKVSFHYKTFPSVEMSKMIRRHL